MDWKQARELRGNLHIHTSESDGSLPLEEVAAQALECGLDYIGINDHFARCRPGYYLDDLLVLPGTELNRRHSHYLAYGPSLAFPPVQQDGGALASMVKRQGGLGIIAHPFETGSPLVGKGRHYPWLNWDSEDFQGIEIWNQTSQWRDSARSLGQGLWQWLFRRYRPFSKGACPRALAKWDSICQQRHVTGVAGSDVHAPSIRVLGMGFRVLDYPMLLGAVNTYCLAPISGAGDRDGAAVISALAKGRCWIAYDRLSSGRGFSFGAQSGEDWAGMGERLVYSLNDTWLHLRLPRSGQITIVRNGAPEIVAEGQNRVFKVEYPGVYRVEVRLRGLPWIYSNPIYIV